MSEDETRQTRKTTSGVAGTISLICGILVWLVTLYAMLMIHSMSPGMGDFVKFLMPALPLAGLVAGLFAVLRGTSRRAMAWAGLLLNGAFLALYAFLYWLSLS